MTRRPELVLAVVAAAIAATNLLASSLAGLGDAEALYWCYGRHLQLSYLDHPPLVGWLIAAATALGGDTALAVRGVSLVCAMATLAFSWLLARDLHGGRAPGWAAALLLATPAFSIGAAAAAPDAPLLSLWALFAWQINRAISDDGDTRWARLGRPILLGAVAGLAFLAKYTGVFLSIGALAMALGRAGRAWLRRPGFWIGAALAAASVLPVIAWNCLHGWAGVLHRLVWTQGGAGLSFGNALALAGGQILYIGPLVIALAAAAAVRLWRDRRERPGGIALLWISLPTLGATYLLALWSDVAEPHWPAPGYLALIAAASGTAIGGGAMARAARWALGLGVAALAIAHAAVLTPILPAALPADLYEPRWDLSNELRGWPEVAETVRAIDRDGEAVVAAHYTQCAQLSFALSRPGDPPVRCASPEIDDFDLWNGPFELEREGALFVTDDRFSHDPAEIFPGAVVGPPLTLEIRRGGRAVRRFSMVEILPAAP